jgi:release factor glutamine methyltransferase
LEQRLASDGKVQPEPIGSDGFEMRLARLAADLSLLDDKPEETPESTLRALWMVAAGSRMSAERAVGCQLPELDPAQKIELDGMIERRLAGVPLGHITARQMFMGIELMVGPEAMLPRRETEILGRAAATVVAGLLESQGSALVVDTCCGCGNVTLAVAHGRPEVRAIGVDLSPGAVELARENSRYLGLDDRVEFRVGDLVEPIADVAGEVDLITCNPPYISRAKVKQMAHEISEYEPWMAFDGGPFGVDILRRLLKKGPTALRPGGILAFEVGLGQGDSTISRMQKSGIFRSSKAQRDPNGAIRAIVAQLA